MKKGIRIPSGSAPPAPRRTGRDIGRGVGPLRWLHCGALPRHGGLPADGAALPPGVQGAQDPEPGATVASGRWPGCGGGGPQAMRAKGGGPLGVRDRSPAPPAPVRREWGQQLRQRLHQDLLDHPRRPAPPRPTAGEHPTAWMASATLRAVEGRQGGQEVGPPLPSRPGTSPRSSANRATRRSRSASARGPGGWLPEEGILQQPIQSPGIHPPPPDSAPSSRRPGILSVAHATAASMSATPGPVSKGQHRLGGAPWGDPRQVPHPPQVLEDPAVPGRERRARSAQGHQRRPYSPPPPHPGCGNRSPRRSPVPLPPGWRDPPTGRVIPARGARPGCRRPHRPTRALFPALLPVGGWCQRFCPWEPMVETSSGATPTSSRSARTPGPFPSARRPWSRHRSSASPSRSPSEEPPVHRIAVGVGAESPGAASPSRRGSVPSTSTGRRRSVQPMVPDINPMTFIAPPPEELRHPPPPLFKAPAGLLRRHPPHPPSQEPSSPTPAPARSSRPRFRFHLQELHEDRSPRSLKLRACVTCQVHH